VNAPRTPRRPTASVVAQSLLWLWLICLSVFVLMGYQSMNDPADRERVDSGLQRLEALVAGLAETTQALQQRPAPATAAGLQETRQALEARITKVEQAQGDRAAAADLQALREEVEQIKTRQATARATKPNPPRPSKPVAATLVPPPLPFRVVGAELRAGQRSVSVAPSVGDFTADQVQVLLPGDAVGSWRLQAIDGNAAVFQAGEQTRRVAIP